MKILQLVNRIPYPLNDGGSIAVHCNTEGFLQAGVELSMLAMNTTRHWVDINSLPPLYDQLKLFKSVRVDNRIRIIPAFLNLFKKSSYNIDRFISDTYKNALITLLQEEQFDIIQLEGLYLSPYLPLIRQYSKAAIAMRQHNIEFRIWQRLAQQAQNPLKKAYLKLLAKRLRRFELERLKDYDIILPISAEDEQYLKKLGCRTAMYLHPFGINISDIPFVPAYTPPLHLYHIGAMDWLPNQESVNWLLDHVMPIIRKELPGIRLYLAGRNMSENLLKLNQPNVIIAGAVPDALAFEKDKSILLVPLLSGGGVRIKIFKGMAMGKTVVTTSIGLEGIDARDGKEVFVADSAEQFAHHIIKLVHEPELIRQTGFAARKLIEKQYDQKKIIEDLIIRYGQLLAGKR